MHADRATFELNCRDSIETFGNVKQKYHVPGFFHASCRQPLVCGFSEQFAVRDCRPPGNRKWGGTKLKASAKLTTVPRRMNAAVGFLPVADPRKVISSEQIQNQESQTGIAHRNTSSFKGWIQ